MIYVDVIIKFLNKTIEDNRRKRETESDQRLKEYFDGRIDALELVKEYIEGNMITNEDEIDIYT